MSSVAAVANQTSQHTPGPWSASGWTTPTGIIRRGIFHQGGRLAMVEGGTAAGTHEQVEANARLIAAAPDLLALAYDVLATRGEHTPARVITAAQAVISRVEGRES